MDLHVESRDATWRDVVAVVCRCVAVVATVTPVGVFVLWVFGVR